MKIKSYTNIEQSKKLAEILPLESADMSYRPYREEGGIPGYETTICPFRYASWIGIPCWSLAALLDVLPYKERFALAINDFYGDGKEKYAIGSVVQDTYDSYADNPVDACYELILKLHELKML